MAEDYYKTLGVARDASQADIQKAHRELARKYHPDLNKEKSAKKKFQEVQRAFEVLSDPSKRELYDRYGSSFEQAAGGPSPGGAAWTYSGQGGPDLGDVFSQFFGERFGAGSQGGYEDLFTQYRGEGATGARRRAGRGRAGADVKAEMDISLATSVLGGEAQITVQRAGGKVDTIAVKVPAGICDGQEIRLRGQGEQGTGGAAGDLLIRMRVAPHPWFQRRENHLHVRLPVTLVEAAGGAKVDVPTPYGTVSLRVPAGTSSGTRLRIKGHGVRPPKGEPGDLFAEVQIVIPRTLDEPALEALRKLDRDHPLAPRRELAW
jgi:DnaJ-class molecular chaperone